MVPLDKRSRKVTILLRAYQAFLKASSHGNWSNATRFYIASHMHKANVSDNSFEQIAQFLWKDFATMYAQSEITSNFAGFKDCGLAQNFLGFDPSWER